MNVNPEFQRNIWLEMTKHRLIGMPLVLSGIFYLVYLTMDSSDKGGLGVWGLVLFCFFGFGWATYLAGETVTGEVKNRTWDIQRMSSIGPWEMTWGKLFGSTIFPWYGALLSLAVAALAPNGFGPTTLLFVLVSALLCQTVALLTSLTVLGKQQKMNRSAAASHLLAGNLAVAPFATVWAQAKPITWYGTAFEPHDLALLSVTLWAIWALVGCYRQMSTELKVASTPAVWVGFLLFVWLFVAGFVPPEAATYGSVTILRLFIGFTLMLFCTYGMVFQDRKEPASIRRMLIAKAKGHWRAFFEDLPCWVPTLVLAAILGAALCIESVWHPLHLPASAKADEIASFMKGMRVTAWVAGTFLFVVRDVLIVLFFNLGPGRARADAAAILYLGILYLLLPGIFTALHADYVVAMLWPWLIEHQAVTLVAGLIQTGGAGFLVYRRWQTGFGTRRPASGTPATLTVTGAS